MNWSTTAGGSETPVEMWKFSGFMLLCIPDFCCKTTKSLHKSQSLDDLSTVEAVSETGGDFTHSLPICVAKWDQGPLCWMIKQRLKQLLSSQFTASSWLAKYSLLCQPVDYSDSPLAMRVRLFWRWLGSVLEKDDCKSVGKVMEIA